MNHKINILAVLFKLDLIPIYTIEYSYKDRYPADDDWFYIGSGNNLNIFVKYDY